MLHCLYWVRCNAYCTSFLSKVESTHVNIGQGYVYATLALKGLG